MPRESIIAALAEYRRIVQHGSSKQLEQFWRTCRQRGCEREVRERLRTVAFARAIKRMK